MEGRYEELAAAVLEQLDTQARQRIAAARPWLAEALKRAEEAWPRLPRADAAWAAYLAAKLPRDDDAERMLPKLQVEELYLCCACARGEPAAIEAFRQSFTPVIAAALRRLRLGQTTTQEVQQQLLVDLLVGADEQSPMIANFGGLGRLANWLRVVAARTGRRCLEREKRLVPSDDNRIADELLGSDVSLPGLKAEYRQAFRAAFKLALTELSPREVSLVKYHYGEAMRMEQIGAIFRVHASTVSRWLGALRARLLQATHQHLAEQLQIPSSECSTIIRMIQDDFNLTLKTLLGKTRAPGEQKG